MAISGVRRRLMLAFLAISGFAVLAAAAGIYAFGEVGSRIGLIDARVPQMVASMEVSRAAERIMAIAPALVGATTPAQRDEASARMRPELNRLVTALNTLKEGGTTSKSLAAIEQLVDALRLNLAALDSLVVRRLRTSEHGGQLLQAVFQTNDEVQQLFTPWLQVMDSQINRLVGQADKQSTAGRALAASLALDRPTEAAQRQFSSLVDLAARTATADDPQRLPVLEFQMRQALDDLRTISANLDPKLRPLFDAELDKTGTLLLGPIAIPAARDQELQLLGNAQKLVAENAAFSARLSEAVDELVSEAERDVGTSTMAAMSVQRLSGRFLMAVAALSLLSSALIVWFYVNRNVIQRLIRLNTGMVAIAAGRQQSPIEITGHDEITDMSRVVEIFRKNTAERDELLTERADAAARLERIVEERTAELVSREAALRVMFDNMSQGVAMFDDERGLVAWNRQFGDLFALPENLQHPGMRFDDFMRFLAERGEFGEGSVDEIVRGRVEASNQAYHAERTRPDGTVLDVRRNPVPGGGFISMYADITAVKRREQDLEAARDAADAAYRELKTAQASLVHAEKMASLGQLTAGIAHEIKNPLNFVNNFSTLSGELLAELQEALASATAAFDRSRRDEVDDLIATLSGNLAKIAEHGRRADGIVKSMLLHSRGGSGERQSADLNALVDEALNLAYHGARAQDPNFNVTLERDLDPTIGKLAVMPQDLTRVFLNLFANGFYATNKRMRDGGGADYRPTLRVATRGLADAVEIGIRDNGAGMTANVRQKLFTPFFTTKPTGEGTGLGLSISYDIVVQQHRGTMTVDSVPAEYTEFVIRLPRAVEADADDKVTRVAGGEA